MIEEAIWLQYGGWCGAEIAGMFPDRSETCRSPTSFGRPSWKPPWILIGDGLGRVSPKGTVQTTGPLVANLERGGRKGTEHGAGDPTEIVPRSPGIGHSG